MRQRDDGHCYPIAIANLGTSPDALFLQPALSPLLVTAAIHANRWAPLALVSLGVLLFPAWPLSTCACTLGGPCRTHGRDRDYHGTNMVSPGVAVACTLVLLVCLTRGLLPFSVFMCPLP